MPLLPLLAVLLTAAPAQPVRLAAPGLTGVNTDKALLEYLNEQLAYEMRARGVEVMTARELGAVLGLERQKQLLGCEDGSSSCLAEVAGGLGVDGILTGDVANLDGTFRLHLKVVSARDARVLADDVARARTQSELADVLAAASGRVAPRVQTALGRSASSSAPVASVSTAGGGMRQWAWMPAAAGLLLAGAGSVGLVMARRDYDALAAHPDTYAKGLALQQSGERAQLFGGLGVGVGAAALLAGGALYLLGGGEAPAQVTVGLGSQGAVFAVGGVLP